jgi:hypothetical protein
VTLFERLCAEAEMLGYRVAVHIVSSGDERRTPSKVSHVELRDRSGASWAIEDVSMLDAGTELESAAMLLMETLREPHR